MAEKKKTDVNLPFIRVLKDEEGHHIKVGPIEVEGKPGKEDVKIGSIHISEGRVNIDSSLNGRLTNLAWAAFFIVAGSVLLLNNVYKMEFPGIIPISVGLILLILNFVRTRVGIEPSTFTIVIGVLALVVGTGEWFGIEINLVAVIIILVGAYIIVTSMRK